MGLQLIAIVRAFAGKRWAPICKTTAVVCWRQRKYKPNYGKLERHAIPQYHPSHEFDETCHSVTSHCTGQFTPKMKANAEPRLLSSLVWIDSGAVVSQHRLESLFMKYNVTEWQVSWNSCWSDRHWFSLSWPVSDTFYFKDSGGRPVPRLALWWNWCGEVLGVRGTEVISMRTFLCSAACPLALCTRTTV